MVALCQKAAPDPRCGTAAVLIVLCLAAGVPTAAAQKPKIYLACPQPVTGGWPAGTSMGKAAFKMTEWINANPQLLPDYDLELIWQDDGCTRSSGRALVYANWFDETYFPVGGPTITGLRTMGILGPGCSGAAMEITPLANVLRFLVISNSAVRPSLSDRKAYPAFWRTMMPDTVFNLAWLAVVKALGFTEVSLIVGSREDSWDAMSQTLMQEAARIGVRVAGPPLPEIYAQTSPPTLGWELATQQPSPGWEMRLASNIVDQIKAIRPRPPRFVVLMMFEDLARLVVCAAYQRGLPGVVFMTIGWLAEYWWRDLSGVPAGFPCTAQQMEQQVNNTITANQDQRRPDLDTRLTCAPNYTARDFFAYYDAATKSDPRPEGAATAEAVCVYAQLFHKMIYNYGATLTDLRKLNGSMYSLAQNLLAATDLEGPQGRLQWPPGSPDPLQNVLVEQIQNSQWTRPNEKVTFARYRDGAFTYTGSPLWLPGTRAVIVPRTVGGSPVLAQEQGPRWENFTTCGSGFVLDLASNGCRGCPAGTFFLESTGQCECEAGTAANVLRPDGSRCGACPAGSYATVAQQNCKSCSAGKYTKTAGESQCRLCELGFFGGTDGMTDCQACPVGQTTLYLGSLAASDCTCKPGWLWVDTTCRQCTELFPDGTVDCAGGRSLPVVHEGYMTVSGSWTIYKCRSLPACPGGSAPGVEACSSGASAVACGKCEDGMRYSRRDGRCVTCNPAAKPLFGIGAVILLLLFVLFLRPPEAQYGVKSLSKVIYSMFVLAPLLQCFELIQFCSILGRVGISWPSGGGGSSEVFKFFQEVLELDGLGVECFMADDKNNYPLRFVVLANLLPAIIIGVSFVTALPSVVFPSLRRWRLPDPLKAVSASVGVMLAFFVTILNWALNLVFSTYTHPDGVTRSLCAFPQVLTSDSAMSAMKAVAIVSIILWCAGTFSLVTFLLYLLPSRREQLFLRRCMLPIICKYTEDMAWWLLIEMGLKIFVSITLTVFEDSALQLAWLGSVLVVYFGLTTFVQPYRFHRHAWADIMLTLGKIFMVGRAQLLLQSNGSSGVGLSIITYVTAGFGIGFLFWCSIDHLRGISGNVEREEAILKCAVKKVLRFVPIQNRPEELVEWGNNEDDVDVRITRKCLRTSARQSIYSNLAHKHQTERASRQQSSRQQSFHEAQDGPSEAMRAAASPGSPSQSAGGVVQTGVPVWVVV